MNCKECKDTRIYQPLVGPPEPCWACADTGIGHPISVLRVVDLISENQLDATILDILKAKAIGQIIGVNSGNFVVQGGPTVLALRDMEKTNPIEYNKLVPGGMLNVTMCDAHEKQVAAENDTGICGQYPIARLQVVETLRHNQIECAMHILLKAKALGCTIKVNKDDIVTFGGPVILALRMMKLRHPGAYDKLVPGDILEVTVCDSRRVAATKEPATIAEEEPVSDLLNNIMRETVYMRQRAATLVRVAKGPPPEDWPILRKAIYLKLQDATTQLEKTAIIARQLSNKLGWSP